MSSGLTSAGREARGKEVQGIAYAHNIAATQYIVYNITSVWRGIAGRCRKIKEICRVRKFVNNRRYTSMQTNESVIAGTRGVATDHAAR
jgi:hypothetical protein